MSNPVNISIPIASIANPTSQESAAGQNGSFIGVLILGSIDSMNQGEVVIKTSDITRALKEKIRINQDGISILDAFRIQADDPVLVLDRADDSNEAVVRFETGGTSDWDVGLKGTLDSDFRVFSHQIAGDALKLDSATGSAQVYGSISSAAPSGGSSAEWKLGEISLVSPVDPDRTIRVEVDGKVLYIHAKTTND